MAAAAATDPSGAGAAPNRRVKLLVVNPNLTVDRTARIPALHPGQVLRTRAVAVTPGGKGVNVVRAATRLGASAQLVGIVAGRIGEAAAAMLADEGIALASVAIEAELRSTLVLIEDTGRVTVINEPGPPITAADWEAFERLVAQRLGGADLLVCSGSVPPGCPSDAFGRLVRIARPAGVRVVIDAAGDLLAASLASAPDVVTPNLAEAESSLQGTSDPEGVEVDAASARRRSLAAAQALLRRGAGAVVVTAGAAGAAFIGRGGHGWVAAPHVEVRNPIGAGDTFTAGLAVALASGSALPDAVVAAVASGAAGVEDALAGGVDPRRVEALRPTLRVDAS